MDSQFQDRIDEYLLHGDTMRQEDRRQFEKEIEQDAEKREQYELTVNVRKALTSRAEKLKAMAVFEQGMKQKSVPDAAVASSSASSPVVANDKKQRKGIGRPWLWLSGVAALLVAGFFSVQTLLYHDAMDGNVRGGDDVFNGSVPNDTLSGDTTTVFTDTLTSRP